MGFSVAMPPLVIPVKTGIQSSANRLLPSAGFSLHGLGFGLGLGFRLRVWV